MRRIHYGANHVNYQDWVQNAPSPSGRNSSRRYFDGINHVPLDWASMKCYSSFTIVSMRLVPEDLIRGNRVPDNGSGYTTLPGQLAHLIGTLPRGVKLTLWQEAGPANGLGFPDYITPAALNAAHETMQWVCRKYANADGGHVKYGQIIIGPANRQADWIAPDLDWYGVDIYDNQAYWNAFGRLVASKLTTRMDHNLEVFDQKSTLPVVHFPETNSLRDSHRAEWFTVLSEWVWDRALLNTYLVSHWDPEGPVSGPWPPSSRVLKRFRELQDTYGA